MSNFSFFQSFPAGDISKITEPPFGDWVGANQYHFEPSKLYHDSHKRTSYIYSKQTCFAYLALFCFPHKYCTIVPDRAAIYRKPVTTANKCWNSFPREKEIKATVYFQILPVVDVSSFTIHPPQGCFKYSMTLLMFKSTSQRENTFFLRLAERH